MQKQSAQLKLLQNQPKAYGGELLKTRKGRSRGRPLDTKHSMHIVLRSTKAVGDWSFRKPQHDRSIQKILSKFSQKYGIRIYSRANVGNHLHLHLKLSNRYTYKPFIRAITSAIAMAVTKRNRWTILENKEPCTAGSKFSSRPIHRNESDPREAIGMPALRFWDYRPYTKIVTSFKQLLTLRDYVRLNQLEGFGVNRAQAKIILYSKSFWSIGSRAQSTNTC